MKNLLHKAFQLIALLFLSVSCSHPGGGRVDTSSQDFMGNDLRKKILGSTQNEKEEENKKAKIKVMEARFNYKTGDILNDHRFYEVNEYLKNFGQIEILSGSDAQFFIKKLVDIPSEDLELLPNYFLFPKVLRLNSPCPHRIFRSYPINQNGNNCYVIVYDKENEDPRFIRSHHIEKPLNLNEASIDNYYYLHFEVFTKRIEHWKNLIFEKREQIRRDEIWQQRVLESKKQQTEKKRLLEIQREQCLSRGATGVCQSSSQNNLINHCDQNKLVYFENIFEKYCYITDTINVVVTMEVRNNLSHTIKDISFKCDQLAKSGTPLFSNKHTEYDLWSPGSVKVVRIKFPKHEQLNSVSCSVIDSKR